MPAEKMIKHNTAPPQQQAISLFSKAGQGFFGNNHPGFFPAAKTKLEVSKPGDPEELEADKLAEKVMRMDDHSLHHE